jgi:hypothetical protein
MKYEYDGRENRIREKPVPLSVVHLIPTQRGPALNLDLPSNMFASLTTWVMAWLCQD